jgi:hypothetical protein
MVIFITSNSLNSKHNGMHDIKVVYSNHTFWPFWAIVSLSKVGTEHIINSLPNVCTILVLKSCDFPEVISRDRFFNFAIISLLICHCVSFVSIFDGSIGSSLTAYILSCLVIWLLSCYGEGSRLVAVSVSKAKSLIQFSGGLKCKL